MTPLMPHFLRSTSFPLRSFGLASLDQSVTVEVKS